MIDSEHLDQLHSASTVYCLWHSASWSGESRVLQCVTAQILVAAISIFECW
jgi:hypothetical protein